MSDTIHTSRRGGREARRILRAQPLPENQRPVWPGMKVVNSLKSAKKRDKNCRVVRRKGRVYVINKSNPRFKARQG